MGRRVVVHVDLVTGLLVLLAALGVLVVAMIAAKPAPSCPVPPPTFEEQQLPELEPFHG